MLRITFRSISPCLAVLLLAFACRNAVGGCSDGPGENPFAPENRVASKDIASYAAGNLGVVPASYWRIYHFLAFRALSGKALSVSEVESLGISGWQLSLPGSAQGLGQTGGGLGDWLAARKEIPGSGERLVITEANIGNYAAIENCPIDAFVTATQTLQSRLQTHGIKGADAWLSGQDAVFANCGATPATTLPTIVPRSPPPLPRLPTLPPPLPADAPQWLKQDRAYQNVAALFYAGQYEAARQGFLAIASDTASPWQKMGSYLAARCLIRQATVFNQPKPEKQERFDEVSRQRLVQAHKELRAAAPAYPAAGRLADWIEFRIQPAARLESLAQQIAEQPASANLPQQIKDFLLLMDGQNRLAMIRSPAPLIAWIGAMQATFNEDSFEPNVIGTPDQRRREALQVARQRWLAGKAAVWLLPILTNLRAGETRPEEIAAAEQVPTGSPAYLSVRYHLARLAIGEGRKAQADRIVDDVLAQTAQPMATATRNRWLALKLVTAQTIVGFVAAAPRHYAEPTIVPGIRPDAKDNAGTPDFDQDFLHQLSLHFSLPQLLTLRDYPALQPMRQQLSEMIWTRAVILGDFSTAEALTDDLSASRATTRHLYERFRKATNPDEKKLAAQLILINTPELHPGIVDSKGRFRQWGCRVSEDLPADGLNLTPPAFMDQKALAEAAREQKILQALPLRTEFLGPDLIAWAKNKPDDAEAPKALHLLVASTRLECRGWLDNPAKPNRRISISKEAFQTLHRLYPGNQWTAKTRHYF